MRSYYRIMLGRKSSHAAECLAEGFIGAHYDIDLDLSQRLPDNWKTFNKEFIPVYQGLHPEKSKIAAGLACGMLWVVSKGVKKGDIILSPDGSGTYRVGEVVGDYTYAPGRVLPHRRAVQWRESGIERIALSEALRRSAGSIGTVSDISGHRDEIERLIGDSAHLTGAPLSIPSAMSPTPELEDFGSFAMEKHLEDFLVANWKQTELGQLYDIYEEDGELAGQQYPTDTGPLDILAVAKDGSHLLVVELKRGRASDAVVGQILRYMGSVKESLCTETQGVKGVVIALEDDQRLRLALSMVPSVSFFRYQVSFRLVPG